jgi:hypothetical protein
MRSGGEARAKANAGPSTALPAKCAGSFAQDDRVLGVRVEERQPQKQPQVLRLCCPQSARAASLRMTWLGVRVEKRQPQKQPQVLRLRCRKCAGSFAQDDRVFGGIGVELGVGQRGEKIG